MLQGFYRNISVRLGLWDSGLKRNEEHCETKQYRRHLRVLKFANYATDLNRIAGIEPTGDTLLVLMPEHEEVGHVGQVVVPRKRENRE